ncbi:MAG: ABC transporter substrate-binding protein [Thermomicrobiales bacterium]
MDQLTKKLNTPFSRRSLVGGAAAAAAAGMLLDIPLPASVIAAQESGQVKEVPRNRTLIFGITAVQITDATTFNPYVPGISTMTGFPYCFEPAFYYNAYNTDAVCGPEGMECDAGLIPWLAESFKYNDDFTSVTIKWRDGVEWSDGTKFTADDVVFTIDMLKKNSPSLTWSIDMTKWVKDVSAADPLTLTINLNEPNPRFMTQFFTYHFDIGMMIVPKHIWEKEDPTTYTFLDIAKGLPVTTGPWKMVQTSGEQRMYDRRDDWWAKKTGFHELPAAERILIIPGADETKMVQLAIANQDDLSIDLRPDNIAAVIAQNPAVQTWTGNKPPYGYRDWWPIGLGFNCMKEPYNDPDIRWALNYAIDREKLIQFAYKGAGESTILPFPKFPALEAYTDTIKDLSDQINQSGQDKVDEKMQGKGWAKGGDGFWAKDGKRFSMVIMSQTLFQDIAPILTEQLRQAGFDASFKNAIGNEFSDTVYTGAIDAFILGHGGSVRDPYFTLNLYHSRYSLPTGQRSQQPYRWVNKDYDAIVDEMAVTEEGSDKVAELFKEAMAIWVKELPDIGLAQWFHRIPTNTTYWSNFPNEENPYINTAFWHRCSPLWINTIKPAQ